MSPYITNDQIALSLEFTPFYDQADDALTPNLTLYEGQLKNTNKMCLSIIYVMKIITNKLIYALTLILLICEVSAHLMKRYLFTQFKKNPNMFCHHGTW